MTSIVFEKGLPFPRKLISTLDGGTISLNSQYDEVTQHNYFYLLRLNSDGSVASTFGKAGAVRIGFGLHSYDQPNDLAALPDGSFLVAGSTFSDEDYDAVVAHIGPDGTLDSKFGANGLLRLDINFGTQDFGSGLKVFPDGSFILGGTTIVGEKVDFFTARFSSQGRLVSSYANSGISILPTLSRQAFSNWTFSGPNGQFSVAGLLFKDNLSSFSVVRFDENGKADLSLNKSGALEQPAGSTSSQITDITAQKDGKMLVYGSDLFAGDPDLVVKRFLNDGSPDNAFGDHGVSVIDVLMGSADNPASIALDSDGRIIITAFSSSGNQGFPCIIRLLPDGAPDLSFGESGRVFINSKSTFLSAVNVQPDHKIVIVGMNYEQKTHSAIRLLENGQLDQ